ncbi:MAG TPA: GNAT family N-acetyltransferase [Solirubrobacteraceae bacterium]|nr:GNAT family N-acetyltransferase [Solirubrobacteraceae bacterium]
MAMELKVTDHPDAARYELTADGERAGFVTYRQSPGVIAFLHAEVDPARERQGLGSELVRGALDDARARGLAVRPVCPFVAWYIETHEAYQDLVAK